MAGYGFDRNEVQVTKTTLIDKDGFIFETDKPYSEDPSDYDVIFIDYDGTVPYTYMAEDFLAMKKFPPDPQHEGLISQGWNWDFDEAQAYVRKYGALVIGETYSPADGATQITINLTSRLHVPVCFSQSINKGVEIDWGDKSRHEYVEGTGAVNASHDYAQPGEYVLRLKAKDGCELGLGDPETGKNFFYGYGGERQSGASSGLVEKIILSDSIKTFYQYAFITASNLKAISLSNSIESITNKTGVTGLEIGGIRNVIFPRKVKTITGFSSIAIDFEFVSFSNSIEEMQNSFMPYINNVKILTLPEKITYISGDTNLGTPNFGSSNKLKTLIIPDNVTSLMPGCFGKTSGSKDLERLYISNGVEEIGDNSFTNLYSLKQLHLPNGLQTIGASCFTQTRKLKELQLPETLETIGQRSFDTMIITSLIFPDDCVNLDKMSFINLPLLTYVKLPEHIETLPYILNGVVTLEKVVIPVSVTSVNTIFNNAIMLHDIIFKPTTPPELVNGGFGRFAPADLRIWVPYSSDHSILDAYKSAASWSTRISQIYELNEDGTIPDDI